MVGCVVAWAGVGGGEVVGIEMEVVGGGWWVEMKGRVEWVGVGGGSGSSDMAELVMSRCSAVESLEDIL